MPGDFDLVKDRVDIVQLVSERVPLKKAGRAWKGLCPFHAEKTPSFTVDPDRRTFKCFGCEASGDVFTWLEKTEGLEPVEALRVLAERAGVELATRRPQEREREKRLLLANDTAHFYFRQALRGTEHGRAAAAYLAGRGILPESVERFGLGYAPDLRDGLLSYLRRKGFSDDEAIAAGLVVETERGRFDRFRDRLIVPIRDGRGRTIAFGGRAMRPDQPAKYVNSPQTLLFNKSATLYALDVARPGIRKAGEAVIVEGYFDAIASHQAGLDNVVASMGTALTEEQYRVLDGLKIERAVVAFDPDAAGAASAERRGRELAHLVQRAVHRVGRGALGARTGLSVYVAGLEGGDPDELARTDSERLRKTLSAAKPVLEFVIDRIAARTDPSRPDGGRRFLAESLPLLADEPDPIVREQYLARLNRYTGVPHEELRAQMPTAKAAAAVTFAARSASGTRTAAEFGAPGLGGAPPAAPGPAKQTSPTERYLMAQLLQFPEEAARLELAPDDLADPDLREIFDLLRAGERPGPRFPEHLVATLAALGATVPEPAGETEALRAIEIAALRLREGNLRRRLSEARATLARAREGDIGGLDAEVALIADELDRLMKARERQTVLRAEGDA